MKFVKNKFSTQHMYMYKYVEVCMNNTYRLITQSILIGRAKLTINFRKIRLERALLYKLWYTV